MKLIVPPQSSELRRTIVITGASSGIGQALALNYAKSGHRLVLFGRDWGRLAQVKKACEDLGAEVIDAAVDLRDHELVGECLNDIDSEHHVDLLIANAGILRGSVDGTAPESNEDSRLVFETNVTGLINTIHPLLPRMIARRQGQIAVMSSIAGLLPLVWCPSYAASKAAVYAYGMSLRESLRPHGIPVSVICPGFIETPMTEQLSGPRRSRAISTEQAAVLIRKGLEKKQALIAFPASLALGAQVLALCPESVRRKIVSTLAVRAR